MPDELAPQLADCREFFEAFGWTVAISESLEADDLLGTYARLEAEAGGRALLLTGDRDMYQCAGERVTVLYVRTGGKGAEEVAPEGVRERYGIDPDQVPDFIALRGDPSDGMPGRQGRRRRRPPPTCSAATARSRRSSTTRSASSGRSCAAP